MSTMPSMPIIWNGKRLIHINVLRLFSARSALCYSPGDTAKECESATITKVDQIGISHFGIWVKGTAFAEDPDGILIQLDELVPA